jgi:hypothetical protein
MNLRTLLLCFLLISAAISVSCSSSATDNRLPAKPSDQQLLAPTDQAKHFEMDIPKLAFVRKDSVEKVLGRPLRVEKDSNSMSWSEGPVSFDTYNHAECVYFRGRLVSITYKFKNRPPTAADVLERSGLPGESVMLDNAHDDHLPYRAFYAPNPDYRNPIRCCGLLLHWVSIPEDRSEITVRFANINDHFRYWPEEIRSAWLRAGGDFIH